ncbi:MAG: hypothetical protein PXX83_06230 [Candidatus Nitrosotalea sp.]|nr:hypothetical protein [Candidatus Nitrosotalea sp.]
MSYYKLTAISSACGRLAQMKRDIKKGRKPKSPYISKPYLVSCYGFKINGILLAIPIGSGNCQHALLNDHTLEILQDKSLKVKSFTITPHSISLSIRKEVTQIIPENVIGIDRNLRNVTISTRDGSIMYKTNKLLSIKENTSHVIQSLKRFDVRVKRHSAKTGKQAFQKNPTTLTQNIKRCCAKGNGIKEYDNTRRSQRN